MALDQWAEPIRYCVGTQESRSGVGQLMFAEPMRSFEKNPSRVLNMPGHDWNTASIARGGPARRPGRDRAAPAPLRAADLACRLEPAPAPRLRTRGSHA